MSNIYWEISTPTMSLTSEDDARRIIDVLSAGIGYRKEHERLRTRISELEKENAGLTDRVNNLKEIRATLEAKNKRIGRELHNPIVSHQCSDSALKPFAAAACEVCSAKGNDRTVTQLCADLTALRAQIREVWGKLETANLVLATKEKGTGFWRIGDADFKTITLGMAKLRVFIAPYLKEIKS